MNYIKKSLKVKAMMYNGNNWDECLKFVQDNYKVDTTVSEDDNTNLTEVMNNYYVVIDDKNTLYTCPQKEFEENYIIADDNNTDKQNNEDYIKTKNLLEGLLKDMYVEYSGKDEVYIIKGVYDKKSKVYKQIQEYFKNL